MIEIKNKLGGTIVLEYSNGSDSIVNNTLIDITLLGSYSDKQGLARLIAMVLADSFEIYKDSVLQGREGHTLLTNRYHELFN